MNPTLENEFTIGRCGDFVDAWDRLVQISTLAKVHPTAVIGENAEWVGRETLRGVTICARTIVRPFVTIDAGVERETLIGRDSLIMAHVHLGHDVQIGERVQIAPHASIGGLATIGNDVKIGMGATIKPHVTIGDGARIGMGACVTKDVPPGEVWVGSPARALA